MFRSLLSAIAIVAFLALSATAAMGQTSPEADSEKAYTNFSNNADKGTVILKVDKDGSMAIMSIDHVPQSDAEAELIAKAGTFAPVDSSKITAKPLTANDKTETDKTSGISSWRVSGGYGGYRGGYGYGYGVGPRGNAYAYGYGYGGGYYGGYVGYANYYPYYPAYYYNAGYYNPCYSWYYPTYNANYYYYNNVGWNTSWYPSYYYPNYAVAYNYGYGRGGYYHRWR